MALGTPVLGAAADILVSATFGGTYEPVSDMTQVNFNSNRPITQTPVLQRSVAYGSGGAREITAPFTGLLSVGDAGQGILNAAEQGGTTVFVKVLFDGTNGFIIECRVASTGYGAAPDGYQERSYELTAVAASTVVGTGPNLFA